MDIEFLKFYTTVVEQNAEYKFENKNLMDQIDKLKKLVLKTHTNAYSIKEYPQHRFDMNSYNFPISSAKDLIYSGFFTKQDLFDHIREVMIDEGYPEYVPPKEE
jgi:hypothetical protein